MAKRYQILKQGSFCELPGKEFDDFMKAVSFMRSAKFNTYLLDREKDKIVAEYTIM